MPSTESNIAASYQKEELFAYRLEEALKRRLLRWAKIQLILLSILANIVVIVSLSAALYAVARSQLGIEIRGAVDRTFETPRQVVDAKITGYQRLLDDDYKRLLDVEEKLLQLRVDLATMSQDVRGKLNSAESTVDKLTTDLDTERLSLFQQIEGKKSGLDLLDRELKEVLVKQKTISDRMNDEFMDIGDIQSSTSKHEENIDNKTDSTLSYMTRTAARIQALEQMTTHIRDGLVKSRLIDLPISIGDLEKTELDHITANSHHTFVLEFQTGENLGGLLGRISDALRLHGFNPAGFFTSEKGYDASKKSISREIMGLDSVLESNDACLVVESIGETYVKEAQQAIMEAGFPSNCVMEAEINLSERMKSYVESVLSDGDKDAIGADKVSVIYILSKRA